MLLWDTVSLEISHLVPEILNNEVSKKPVEQKDALPETEKLRTWHT